MPKGGRKKRKMSTPQKVWSKVNSRSPRNDAEGNGDAEDLECYTELEVEEVADEADRVVKEEDDDDEVHRIDASWIKQEPVEEELYIHSQEEQNGDVHVMKRKRNEEGEDDPHAKYFKTEPEDEYVPINLQELMRNIVKPEEEDDESDDYWEEDESDVVREEDRVHMRTIPLQKCAKCAIMFTPGSSKLPSALQNLCKKCKPNVSMSCKICGKHFEHHKLYKRHMRDCGNNRFECSVCKNRFPTERKLNYHKCEEENFMRMLRYICPICSEGFEKAKYRNHHKGLHVTVKPIKCKSCKLHFTTLPAYQEHNDTHDVSRSFICLTCHVSFDTRAEFFADQRKHKAQNGDKHEIERPPDFAYVCRKCKHWYSDLNSFRSHSCINQKECFRGDFSQASVVPRLLDFGEASEKMIHTGTRMDCHVRQEPPKRIHVYYPVKGPLLLPKPIPVEVTVPPADKEGQDIALDSTYTCQLCQVSFKNSLALGYHSCLIQHNAFFNEDDEDEEESDEPGDSGSFQGQSGNGAIRIKLTSGLKTLNFSDVMSRAEPNQANHIPTSSATNGNQTNSNFKQSHRCLLCSTVVRHNFEPMLGKESARYLCPRCMKNAAKEKNCVFKCSKCGQTFPTWSRLHMHLPWHKEKTGEEGVFKEPHLACKYLPQRQEEASIPSSSKHSPSVSQVVSEPGSVGKEHNAACPEPQESLPASVTNSDITLLSALLKEPVNPLKSQNKTTSNDTEAGHQEVKSRLRKKLNDKNIHVRIAPKLPIANSLVGNQLVINAPLISPKNPGGGTVFNQDDSLFSQITRGMFPPVVDSTTKDLAKNEKEPSSEPENNLNVQEYRHQGMRVKITKDGPRKTVQLLPDEPRVHVQPKTAAGALFSPDQSAVSTSIPVGTIACVTAPLTTGINTTVPLAFGGNSLKKTNLDGSSSTLTSLGAVYTRPPVIPSVKQIDHSSVNLNLQNIQPAPSAPFLVSVPVDPSQPSNAQTPRGVFLCHSCNLIFMDIESLKAHGCRIRAFSCHMCTATFQTPEQLYNHKCSTQTFICHMCNKKCSSAKELNQHPCIDTNDIRMGQGSNDVGKDNPMNKGSVTDIETGGKGSTTGQDAGQGAGQRVDAGEMDNGEMDNGEMDKHFRALSWGELTKVKDFTCSDCSIKFNSQASLYIHKMKHNMRV